MVALEALLADEQPQPVRAAARHHVRHLVDHEHLARAELVCDARRARAAAGGVPAPWSATGPPARPRGPPPTPTRPALPSALPKANFDNQAATHPN